MTTHRPRATPATAVALIAIGLVTGCSLETPAPIEPPVASPAPTVASASPSSTPSAPAVDPAEVTAARESLAAGIASGDTAALASWFTDPVQVTIAASSFSEALTPFEAAAQTSYIVDPATTWDFALPAAKIDQYRAGSYTDYFPEDVLVGLSSDGRVVAFAMSGPRASAVFLCIDEQALI